VAGRDRTCGAPRFKRALYRLSYGHMSGQGWPRTSDLLFVRQALIPTELLALMDREGVEPSNHRFLCRSYHYGAVCFAELSAIRPTNPGQGVEPRPPRSERGVLPVRPSRNVAGGHPGAEAPAG